MSKGIKIMCKILSVFLAVLFVIEILPTQIMAEAYTNAVAEKQFIEELINNPTDAEKDAEAEILYEVEDKRDEYTKVYKKSDGTYTAVMTEEPLHYLDEGVWKEIDNSMILDGSLYTNLSNLFNVELPKNIDENKELTVEKDGYELSFSVDNIENSSAVVENDIVASNTEIADADSAIAQTQSSVTYSNIADNTDLQYIVTPNSIKENIIVSNKESVKDTYTFTFETNGLNAEKQDDGSVLFKDDNGDVKFRIPRPVMTDANFAFSYDIGVSLTKNANGTITLEYAPSIDWTSSSDRVYPITIDPAIMVDNKDVSWAEDVCVIDDSTNETDQDENFYDDFLGVVASKTIIEDGVEKSVDAEIYTKINTDWFENFGNDIIITEAQYLFAGASMNGCALAKEIAETVDLTTVTYTTKPEHEDEVFDYYTSPYVEGDETEMGYQHFNITKPFNDWLSGATNNGFAIVSGNADFYGLFYMNGVYSYTNPTTNVTTTKKYSTAMCIDFVDLGGYNENLNYHSQSVGRAGTGYVSDFTQHLSVIRDDLSIDGNIMPYTVTMLYDPAIIGALELLEAEEMQVYGNGWAPSCLRTYFQFSENGATYYTETGSAIDFTWSTNEDGEVVFTEPYADVYGESGYTVEYHSATDTESEYICVIRPDGYVEVYNSANLVECIYNPDYPEQKISFIYETVTSGDSEYARIDYITDGAGRIYDYIYDETTGFLSKVKCYSAEGEEITAGTTNLPLEVSYAYDSNKNLTSVTYPDGKAITYTYDSNGNLTSMENIDGYRVFYSYDSNGRVTNVTEQAHNGTDYVDGNYITYERLSATQIKLTDGNGNYEIYQFGSKGNLLYTIDSNGNYVMNEGSNLNDDTYFVSSGDYRANAENLLLDSSFEDDDDCWSNTNSAFDVVVSENAYFGDNVCIATRTSNTTVYQKQTVEVLSGGEYTFSAYVKSDESNTGKLYLNVSSYNSSNTKTETESIPVESTGGEWQRYSVTIDAPSNTNKIVVEFGFKSSMGTFYIDNVQLEQSSSANEYNYIENGGFRNDLESWTASNDYSIVDTVINDVAEKAVVLTGGTTDNNTLYQTVRIDGKKDDVFTVGGWLKALFLNSSTQNAWILNTIEESTDPKLFNFTNDRYAQIEVSYQYTQTNENEEEETFTETIVIPFSENLNDWQFAAQNFVLKGDCETVTVLVRYSKNANSALVSNIELTKDEDAVVFTDEETTEDTETCPCEDCEEIDCTCTCESEALCGCVPCQRRSSITEKDTFGNITSSSSFDGVKTIQTLAQYSEDGNYLVSETDEDGNTVTYDYDLLNGLLKAVTDAKENKTSYTYDANGSLTQVLLDDSSATYTYENDKLTAITHNGFSYNLSYDLWGQLIQVSVGTQPIISYTYGENEYRDRIVSSIYHNDDSEIYDNSVTTTTEYQYDGSGNITEIIVNGETKFIYTYDSLGGLTEISATDSRIIRYTDERTDILDFDDNYIYSSYTNDDGDFIEIIGGVTYTSKSYDSTYDIATGITTEKSDVTATNGKTIGTIDKQDWFGRYTESVVKTESATDTNSENTFAAVKTEYTYSEYDDNKTSNRVETYVNKVYNGTSTDGDNYNSYTGYSYDYDANGNIIAEYSLNAGGTETLRYGYVYDELNQLVRVNDAVAQKTYTYTYDGAGNILVKTTYPYTTEELGTATETLNYTYDTTWTDKLMSYGTTSIEYDDIGNPTRIGNENFYWSGRQLETYVNGTKTIEFEYDENGLRHRKTVKENGVITEKYDYVWVNGSLVSQTYATYSNGEVSSTNTAKFIYDAWGTLQGFVLNDTATYLYTKNLQGDILSIVNENGQTILTYSYDAWGAVTFSATTMQNMMLAYTLSFVSPFTYRGYCYDYDIELYYLQSRYYSAEIGRFINTDDTQIAIATQGEILGANLFAYCNNNPVMNVDFNGYISISKVFGVASILSAVLSALGTIALLAFKQTPWGKLLSFFIAATAIVTNVYSYLSALKSAKKYYGKNSSNYKNLIKFNTILLIVSVAAVIIGEILSVRYLLNYSATIAYALIKIRTFTIIGMTFSVAELFSDKSLYYRSRVRK